jgi:cell division protein ZapA
LATQKKLHEVKIAGVSLKIRSAHDEETVNQLVQFVNDKINEALAVNKSGSFQDSMLLASLNMAEELVLLKKHARRELDRLDQKTRSVISELEASRAGLNN